MSKTATTAQAAPAEKNTIVTVDIQQPETGRIYISPELGLPPDCYDEAIKWITKKKAEDSMFVDYSAVLNVYPTDGANALYEVLRKKFGWIDQPASWTKPPAMIEVETDFGKSGHVPWGTLQMPGVNAMLTTNARKDKGIWIFVIGVHVMKMHKHIVDDIVAETKAYVRTHSIYGGNNVRLEWGEPTMFDEGAFEFPIFLKKTELRPTDLILSEDLYDEVEAGLFSLILNANKARAMGVPSKRLTILAGDFGTGKTLTAAIVGELCREMGRTFIYLADIAHLADAIRFSTQYAPALIFGEDIDTITDEDKIDELSNTVDGVDTKALDVMVVLTTNHLTSIPKKFLRPGRSDLIIEFEPPDGRAAGRLVLKYGGLSLDESFTHDDAMSLGEELSGMIPASIREVVERAKLFAIGGGRDRITKRDIHLAAKGVRRQCDLLKPKASAGLPDGWTERGIIVVRPNANGDTVSVG